MGQVCPGEVVTYTCVVDQGATVGWTAAPVLTDPTAVVFVATAPSDQTTRDCSAVASIRCTELDFYAKFTNISTVQNGIADLSSTFRFTARAGVNGTVVQCMAATESGAPRANQSLIVAGKSLLFANYDYFVSLYLIPRCLVIGLLNNTSYCYPATLSWAKIYTNGYSFTVLQ